MTNKKKLGEKTSEMWDEFFKYEEFPLKHRMIVDEHSFETLEYKEEITLVKRKTLPNMDTGTITIDGGEFYTDNHTFPLANGVFTKNSTGTIDDLKFFHNKVNAWFTCSTKLYELVIRRWCRLCI